MISRLRGNGATNFFAGTLSTRIGRKPLIVGGMLLQAAALGLFAATEGFTGWAIAALTAASGIVVLVRMYETHPRHDRTPVPDDTDLES